MCFLTSFRVLFRVTNRSRISASCRAQFRDDPSSSSGMLFIGSWRTSSCWGQRGPERLGLLETRSWQAARERLGGRSRPCTFVQDYGFVLLCFCAFVLLCFCTFVLLYFRSVLLDFGYRAPCRNGLGRVTFRGVRPDPNHAPANPDPSPCRGCAVYLCPLVGSDLTGPECTEDFTSPPASTLPSTRPGGGNLRGDEPRISSLSVSTGHVVEPVHHRPLAPTWLDPCQFCRRLGRLPPAPCSVSDDEQVCPRAVAA